MKINSDTPLPDLGAALLAGHEAAIAEFVRRQDQDDLRSLADACRSAAKAITKARWADPRMQSYKAPDPLPPVPKHPYWDGVMALVRERRSEGEDRIRQIEFDHLASAAFVTNKLLEACEHRLAGRGLTRLIEQANQPQAELFSDR